MFCEEEEDGLKRGWNWKFLKYYKDFGIEHLKNNLDNRFDNEKDCDVRLIFVKSVLLEN